MDRKHNKEITSFAKELRKNMTDEEKHLWYDFLRSYPVRFSRQKILGKYIADFYCAKANLVIELDGSEHYTEEGRENDKIRTDYLNNFGITVMRITNLELNQNFPGVCAYIDNYVKNAMKEKNKPPRDAKHLL